jgi:hypothetical protein
MYFYDTDQIKQMIFFEAISAEAVMNDIAQARRPLIARDSANGRTE